MSIKANNLMREIFELKVKQCHMNETQEKYKSQIKEVIESNAFGRTEKEFKLAQLKSELQAD